MSELGHLEAILLGVVQGLTEFLPVSSSGHLAIIQRWMGLVPDSPPMLLFDVLAHLGTLGAVLLVFAPQIRRFADRLARECRRGWKGRRLGWRIVLLAIAATIPTAAVGLSLQGFFEGKFNDPFWIGGCLIVTGLMLALLVSLGRARRGWRQFQVWQAALVGFAQAGAILPGISRSGATICVARYCGLRRRWAAEFSFLIAAPAILGGVILKTSDVLSLPADELSGLRWAPILLGSVVSFLVGVIALRCLLGIVRRAKLHYFAAYCWLLGAAVFTGILWP